MDKRTTLQPFGNGFWRITMKFGFMNVPDVPRALQLCNKHQGLRLDDDPDDVTYFLSRLTAVPTTGQGMALWRERLFVMMSASASNAAEYFRMPAISRIQQNGRASWWESVCSDGYVTVGAGSFKKNH